MCRLVELLPVLSSSKVSRRARNVAGIVGGLGLIVLTLMSWGPRALEFEGVVEPGARFAVSSAAGEVRWELSEHGQASGLRVVSQGALQLDNGETLRLEVKVDPGAQVREGQVLAVINSDRLNRLLDELEAKRNMVRARLDLMLEGGRPETIAAASREVDVARSQLAAVRTEERRLSALELAAAVAPAELDAARAVVDVRERELALAQALLAEARLPPRSFEVAELKAELAAVDSRLVEARRREVASTIISPVDGHVGLGREGELLVVVADGDRFVRVPVPGSSVVFLHVGDAVEFAATGTELEGHVIDISSEAQPLGGEVVFWVAVDLEHSDVLAPGATGMARFDG